MSKKVIRKVIKKPKKKASSKRPIDKIKLVVGDESRPFVQANQPSPIQLNQEWDRCSLGSVQPYEHDRPLSVRECSAIVAITVLSMGTMSGAIWWLKSSSFVQSAWTYLMSIIHS